MSRDTLSKQVESEFYKEVQLLEVKYMKQYQPILDKVEFNVGCQAKPRPFPLSLSLEKEDSDWGV